MMLEKKNVVVYVLQLDTKEVESLSGSSFDLCDLFKREFKKEGLLKEADRMDKGGFSYKEVESNSYYKEFEVSILTKRTIL